MSAFKTLNDLSAKGKRVLVRVDLNVPMDNGRVSDATRLERVTKTIAEISDHGGKVILLSHFGRPKGFDAKESLKPVAITVAIQWSRSDQKEQTRLDRTADRTGDAELADYNAQLAGIAARDAARAAAQEGAGRQ